jgi:hypothetical protein
LALRPASAWSSALESFGVRAWILPVAGSLPLVSSVALIL